MTTTDQGAVTVETLGRIARVTLDRPAKRNALSRRMLDELSSALAELDTDPGTSVVVIRGRGPSFSSGYDISPGGDPERTRRRAEGDVLGDWQAMRSHTSRWLALWNMATPTIAQVHGYCLGGGAELALMCDLVIAADDAQIGHPVVRDLGVPPAIIYPYLVGMRRAKDMMLTGKLVTGAEAAQIGLINRSVPVSELEAATLAYAAEFADVPKSLLAFNKHATNAAFNAMGIEGVLRNGATMDALAHTTNEVKAVIDALSNTDSIGRSRSKTLRPSSGQAETGAGEPAAPV